MCDVMKLYPPHNMKTHYTPHSIHADVSKRNNVCYMYMYREFIVPLVFIILNLDVTVVKYLFQGYITRLLIKGIVLYSYCFAQYLDFINSFQHKLLIFVLFRVFYILNMQYAEDRA